MKAELRKRVTKKFTGAALLCFKLLWGENPILSAVATPLILPIFTSFYIKMALKITHIEKCICLLVKMQIEKSVANSMHETK